VVKGEKVPGIVVKEVLKIFNHETEDNSPNGTNESNCNCQNSVDNMFINPLITFPDG